MVRESVLAAPSQGWRLVGTSWHTAFWGYRFYQGLIQLKPQPINLQSPRHPATLASSLRYLISYFYTTLMAGYRRLGRKQDCFTLLGVMQQHAVLPSATVFSVLQQACWGHLDATGEVRQILRLMEDMNVQPETSNYNALIRTYGDAGLFTNALQVANRLREAGVPWNEFTYTYLIFAAVNAGQVELAVRLLSQMRSDGVRPTSKQYISVFLGLAQAGYYEDAKRVFKRLVKLGSCGTQAFNVMIGDLFEFECFEL